MFLKHMRNNRIQHANQIDIGVAREHRTQLGGCVHLHSFTKRILYTFLYTFIHGTKKIIYTQINTF